jgi:hypothetical protein
MQSVLNGWIGKECAKQSKQLCAIPDNSDVIELQTRGPNNEHLQNVTTTNLDFSSETVTDLVGPYPADVCLRSVTGSLLQKCAKLSSNLSGTNS